MFHRKTSLVLALFLGGTALAAEGPGTASGQGSIERLVDPATGATERAEFSPRFSFAYSETVGKHRFTWIVLTDKEPPIESWLAAKDRAEARRLWCGQEKASFVAARLDAAWKVNLYFLCPANGAVNTEMVSSANGLDSVVVRFEVRDGKRLQGTLRTGSGSCPGPDGGEAYCEATGDYRFDSPLSP